LQPFDDAWVQANFTIPDGTAVKGKTYLPPTGAQIIPLVFYNKSQFAKAGIAKPPANYAEFLADCAALKAHGLTPMELGGNDPFAAGMPLTAVLSVDVLGKDPQWIQKRYAGSVKFSDANVAAAAKKVRTLVTSGYFETNALNVSYADSIKNFNSGATAMYPMGSWYLGAIPKDQQTNIGVFPWPSDDGTVVLPFSVGGQVTVSSHAKNVDEAITFAKTFALQPATLAPLISGDGLLPLIKGKTLADYGVTVGPAFQQAFNYIPATDNTKVSSFGWAVNDNSLPGSLNNKLYAAAQALFNSDDVAGEMAKLDASWASASK